MGYYDRVRVCIGLLLGLAGMPEGWAQGDQPGAECNRMTSRELEEPARAHLQKERLIRPGDEFELAELQIRSRWSFLKTVFSEKHCFVVMALCTTTKQVTECGDAPFEVFGIVRPRGDSERTQVFVPFTELRPVPKTVVAKIGSKDGPDLSYYYVPLQGDSAVSAVKSWFAKVPNPGFSGTAVRGTKGVFDPTPGRNWNVINASFDLRRGMTAEVLDVQAFQLDGLDEGGAEGYWQGCQEPPGDTGQRCLVAPWAQAYIRGISEL